MIDYINNILGIKASITVWPDVQKLPFYLQTGREYYLLQILNTKCLVIKLNSGTFNLPSFQKQINQIEKYGDFPIVLCFDTMTAYQRQALIDNKLSFIVPGSQLYVPFLGISLKEYFQSVPNKVEKLTAMSQFVLLYMIYDKQEKTYSQIELATLLDISAMNVSRSIQELEALGLILSLKRGRLSYISSALKGKAMYDFAKPYLQNPVSKKLYVRAEEPYLRFLIAGEEALAERSMINAPKFKVRAIDKRKLSIISNEEFIDPNWENSQDIVELEVWKYNPQLLAKDRIVDEISLALSLQDTTDERVEAEVNEMLEEFKW